MRILSILLFISTIGHGQPKKDSTAQLTDTTRIFSINDLINIAESPELNKAMNGMDAKIMTKFIYDFINKRVQAYNDKLKKKNP